VVGRCELEQLAAHEANQAKKARTEQKDAAGLRNRSSCSRARAAGGGSGRRTIVDKVILQGDRAIERYDPAAFVGSTSVQGVARNSDNGSLKRSRSTQSRGAPNVPENIVVLSRVDPNHHGRACRGECAANLEDNALITQALPINHELSRQLGGRVVGINSRRKLQATEVLSRQVLIGRQTRKKIVGGQGIGLSLHRHRIAVIYGSIHDAWREARD